METKEFKFHGKGIRFATINDHVMVNASDMASAFDANVYLFFSTSIFQNLFDALSKEKAFADPDSLVTTDDNKNFWIYRAIAYKYAEIFTAEFEVWVYTHVDEYNKARFSDLALMN